MAQRVDCIIDRNLTSIYYLRIYYCVVQSYREMSPLSPGHFFTLGREHVSSNFVHGCHWLNLRARCHYYSFDFVPLTPILTPTAAQCCYMNESMEATLSNYSCLKGALVRILMRNNSHPFQRVARPKARLSSPQSTPFSSLKCCPSSRRIVINRPLFLSPSRGNSRKAILLFSWLCFQFEKQSREPG